MFHDVAWPHTGRQPTCPSAFPRSTASTADKTTEPEISEEKKSDFTENREGPRASSVVPAFFGFEHPPAPPAAYWSDAVAKVLDPFDRDVLVERLEANRVSQIVERSRDLGARPGRSTTSSPSARTHGRAIACAGEEIRERAARLREFDARLRPQQAVLRRLLNSRALAFVRARDRAATARAGGRWRRRWGGAEQGDAGGGSRAQRRTWAPPAPRRERRLSRRRRT